MPPVLRETWSTCESVVELISGSLFTTSTSKPARDHMHMTGKVQPSSVLFKVGDAMCFPVLNAIGGFCGDYSKKIKMVC